jgi:hypothetical protein
MKPDAVLFAPLVALGLLLALARGLGGQVPAPPDPGPEPVAALSFAGEARPLPASG